MNKDFGFTLIELLVVVALIGILTAITLPYFGDFARSQTLNQGVEQIKSDLRTVQNRAQNGIDKKDGSTEYFWWGVDFDSGSGSYRLVQSSNDENNPSDDIEVRREKSLPEDVEVQNDVTIWYKMVTVEVYVDNIALDDSTDISVSLGSMSRSVTVTAGGEVN
ncbi:MAG: prepilin-type N-terminal cleavage/methylation domain-containing protein [Patescibacteria group bacterium]|nr:prepilin-type N-terminal cleavage/methylation domain-containing protein [Patescibacteria group bacterium]